jgi:hypothetical protein
MWKVLKAELQYTRDVLIVVYTIAVLFWVVAIYADWAIYNYMWNTTITYFILMGILASVTMNEKRYRFHSALPVTPMQLVIADGLYIILAQIPMCILWIALLLYRSDGTAETLWAMLANNATILSVTTIFGIHYHLGFFGTTRYRRLNWGLLLALILTMAGLGYFGRLDDVARFLWRHYASGPGALITILVWIALSVLSGVVFLRRRSYLA